MKADEPESTIWRSLVGTNVWLRRARHQSSRSPDTNRWSFPQLST